MRRSGWRTKQGLVLRNAKGSSETRKGDESDAEERPPANADHSAREHESFTEWLFEEVILPRRMPLRLLPKLGAKADLCAGSLVLAQGFRFGNLYETQQLYYLILGALNSRGSS